LKFKSILVGLIWIAAQACDQIYQPTGDSEEDSILPIARANDIFLYEDDIIGLVPSAMSSRDSSAIITKYIESWIKKQLTIARASTEIDFDEANIARKILDYRYALMIHEYETYYINQHLDKEVTDQEVVKYYEEKFENFVLRQNIIRCLFAIVPLEVPQVNNFRQLIRSYPDTDLEEIQSYCYRFATKSSLETAMWLNFDEVISSTPLANIQDRVTFLKGNSFVETSDENNYYFIRILDYKISNQISPLEFIKDDIVSILINKKKVELRKKLEDEIYKIAEEKNEFEIY